MLRPLSRRRQPSGQLMGGQSRSRASSAGPGCPEPADRGRLHHHRRLSFPPSQHHKRLGKSSIECVSVPPVDSLTNWSTVEF